MKICPNCKCKYSDSEFYCIKDNYRLHKYTEEQARIDQSIDKEKQELQKLNNIPKCPICQSTNIQKISSINRAVHGLAFGLFSKTARSQWVCNNCGNKW